jgi:signal recognition particle receptor subunit beta
VAANKQDIPEAWSVEDLRIALKLDPSVRCIPCVASDKEKVKPVLLELLNSILQEIESGDKS